MPTSNDVIADSQNVTITFNNLTLAATSIKSKVSQPTVDTSTLTLASGSARKFQPSPLKEAGTFAVEFLGSNAPTTGVVANLNISAPFSVSGNAICEDVEITAAVGELLKGTCNFKLTAT